MTASQNKALEKLYPFYRVNYVQKMKLLKFF